MREARYTAFAGHRLLAAGGSAEVAKAATAAQAAGASHLLIFDDTTGEQVEVDPFAEAPTIAGRDVADAPRAGRGRPKLGVVAREVTLLPRHWDWLATQPGGASAALRRLVEEASRRSATNRRQAQEALYRVMTALAGDAPAYEEAVRALFAGSDERFDVIVEAWPPDLRSYLERLAQVERAARALD